MSAKRGLRPMKVRAEMARRGLTWQQLQPWWSPDIDGMVDPLKDAETLGSVRSFMSWLWSECIEAEAAESTP